MSSERPPTTIQDESDTAIDLSKTFRHPAGLRVARYVVGRCIRAAENTLPPPAAETITHHPTIPTFESSPDVTSLLQTILALNDSEIQRLERDNVRLGEFAMEGYRSNESRAANDYSSAFNFPQSDLYGSRSQQTTNDLFATSNNSLSSSSARQHTNNSSTLSNSLHQSLAITSRSSIDSAPRPFTMNSLPSLAGGGSQTPDTDSPYRIESPSRTPANNTPQPSQNFQSSRPLLPASDHSFNSDLHQSRLPPMRKSLSNDSAASHTNGASGFGSGQRGFSSGLGQNVTAVSSSPSISIKSFMPVNKTTDGTIIAKPLASNNTPFAAIHAHRTSSNSSSQQQPLISASRSTSLQRSLSPQAESAEMVRTESRKRKAEGEQYGYKKVDTEKGTRRIMKLKEPKAEPAAHKLTMDIWLRILEFTPPSFIKKARLLNRDFKEWIDTYSSIYVNQRTENFGADMPPAMSIQVYLKFDEEEEEAAIATTGEDEVPATPNRYEPRVVQVVEKKGDINERQYNDLLGGKGCLEKGKIVEGQDYVCEDEKASRTHWSWAQRWCWECWKLKIEREDRILKSRQNNIGRQVLLDLLACIPNGMHDSFLKPHDFVTEEESRERTRGAPRLYRYYLKQDVERVIAEYNKRTPLPYVDDPALTPAANASAKAVHQIKETALIQKRSDWVEKMKLKNSAWMETVKKIEAAIRKRRGENAEPNNENRAARRKLFTRRAEESLPHIPIDFVQKTTAYKAATRIFRDPGTDRGWQTLKPKIEAEWKVAEEKKTQAIIDLDENDRLEVEDTSSHPYDLETSTSRPNMNHGISYSHMQLGMQMAQAQMQRNQHQHQQLLPVHRVQQQTPMQNLQASGRTFMGRYRIDPSQATGLGVLAAAASASYPMNSSFRLHGDSNSFHSQSANQHNHAFSSGAMRFDHRSHGSNSFLYGQYPSTNTSNCQNNNNQDHTRTGLSIGDLLAEPSNAGYKSTQSQHGLPSQHCDTVRYGMPHTSSQNHHRY